MKKRIFSFMCLTAFAAIVLTSCLIVWVTYHEYETRMKNEVRMETGYIMEALSLGGRAYLGRISGTDKRITLIDGSGVVLFDNRANPATMENHLERPEIRSALENGQGEAERVSDTLSEKTYYYALRLQDGSILRVAYTNDTLLSSVSSLLPYIALVCLVILLFLVAMARILTGRIVSPLNTLDLDHPESNSIYDELSPLLSKINRQNAEIKKQMDLLCEKQQEFSAITENMSEGFLVVDRNTDILSYNSGALKLFNARLTSKKNSVFTLNRSESFRRAVDLALAGHRNEQLLQLGSLHYQIIANPVITDGRIAGAVLLIVDVTEKEERENLRREFTANVSHELKTPLTSVSGFSEIIRDKLAKPEDIPRFAGYIHKEAQRLITLIDDIIKLSQLDEGLFPCEKESVELYALSEEVLAHLEPAAAQKNVALRLTGVSAEVMGVRAILQEMLANLCDNAVKYNKDGGSVTVTVFSDPGSMGVTVSDTGIGIPRDQLKRVFERFYRVDKSHSKEIGGTGLGLSIVKHGALFHGASVKLDSTLGQGTTVTISWVRRPD